MRYLFFYILILSTYSVCAQKKYFLYGVDYVDTKVKYFEIEYDTLRNEIFFFNPINKPVLYSYQIKSKFEKLAAEFPDSLTLDTTFYTIIDSTITERKLLYKAKWNKEKDSIFLTEINGYADTFQNARNILVLNRRGKQSSRLMLANCEWDDCGSFNRDWDADWWVRTKYKGKKKIASLENRQVFIFKYYYESKLDNLKWYSTIYFDTKSLLPVGLIIQKLEWKYNKGKKYMGIGTKKYFIK
ncbi:hypothetical protein [Fluviicola taffensis]|uniref:Uncharacterized protein n=1 Tax=Fluviicola taffensis (strain DSM 16823 / NCIMB 13979 / RW262) TaxID=755732 RepID=F2IEX0_FLUTR|nr:hypothetical protein [Fluviicola taffensis]AEA42435.1 hypothetical protein Fluta_0429 [Fluviicola taffensis DSM 16823]